MTSKTERALLDKSNGRSRYTTIENRHRAPAPTIGVLEEQVTDETECMNKRLLLG